MVGQNHQIYLIFGQQRNNMKSRVAYLDVDDTILIWSNDYAGTPAPRAKEFILWLNEHFEIRWLTMWATSGTMSDEGAKSLSDKFNGELSAEFFKSIVNPKGFWNDTMWKTNGIDFNDSRPWIWIEDHLIDKEYKELASRGKLKNFYKTNVSHNIVMLQKTWKQIAKDFNLPTPYDFSYYSKTIEYKSNINVYTTDSGIIVLNYEKEI